MESGFLTSRQVADLVQVSPSTVLTWIDRGLLGCFRTPGGHRRIRPVELVAFLRAHEMPIPSELLPQLRLLAIDDDLPFLRGLKRTLARIAPELEVEVAAGAIDGLLKVGTFQPHVVLLDAYMPGMDGVEVCKRLRAAPETAGVAVIALTGRPSPELAAAFRTAGARELLAKPVSASELVGVLEKHRLVGRPEKRP